MKTDFCKYAIVTAVFFALVWTFVFVCHHPDVEMVIGAIVMTTLVASLNGLFAAKVACPYARQRYPESSI